MDFFRSILADDPEPEDSDDYEESETDPRPNQSPNHQEIVRADDNDDDDDTNPNSSGDRESDSGGGLWSFEGLVKTLTTKSESVLETYRRDLQEFGSGLRKESDLFREVASRAVKELPASIEVGASAIDGVLKSTADIIAQGKDVLLAPSDVDDPVTPQTPNYGDRSLNSRRYSRFESQLNAIRNDTRTFCEDPEDLDDYNKWKLGFVLGDKKEEIEKLVGDNGVMEGMYKKVVPNEVDDGTFWFRYFYRVHKLKQQEDMRANLVKRSLSGNDEEELTWDVDDDDEEEEANQAVKPYSSNTKEVPEAEKKENPTDESKTESSKVVDDGIEKNTNVGSVDKDNVEEPESSGGNEKNTNVGSVDKDNVEEPESSGGSAKNSNVGSVDKDNVEEPNPICGNVSNTKVESEPNSDEKVDNNVESGKESDVSIVSTQPPLQDEEDLEWDEIEDVGSGDEKKSSQGDTRNKEDLRKRLSTAEEDEDLSWDIEDDDEPVKAASK